MIFFTAIKVLNNLNMNFSKWLPENQNGLPENQIIKVNKIIISF